MPHVNMLLPVVGMATVGEWGCGRGEMQPSVSETEEIDFSSVNICRCFKRMFPFMNKLGRSIGKHVGDLSCVVYFCAMNHIGAKEKLNCLH